ncbi:hypothetical protein [Thauera humireducens]|uniref:hypothetical protein n=1 Tax=Thauera humireducens TaxID=1134435 RepID=UPI00311EEB9F
MSTNKIQKTLEKLLVAADNHGEDDDPDHTVGDLQGLLRRSWEIMSVGQKLQLLRGTEVLQRSGVRRTRRVRVG